METKATRRDLVRRGIGLAVAGSLTVGATAASAATSAASGEAQALSYALEIERVAVLAYRQVLATNVLSAGVRSELQVMLAQDLEHVAKLERALRQLGAVLPSGPTGTAAAHALLAEHHVHRSLTVLPTQHDCLRVLIDVESLSEGAYFKAMPDLTDRTLIELTVAIMGSDSQHWTVLSNFQHSGNTMISVPYPFVQGSA